MKVVVAKRAGFCFGVKRAVDMAFEAPKERRRGVCTLGPVIHNPQVVERLREAGVVPVDSVEDLQGRVAEAVVIRTHGVTVEVARRLDETGLEVIDATCPFVKKAQHYAKLLRDEGYQVVILGDRDHPEVQSLVSHAGEEARVVSNPDEAVGLRGKVGVVVQTTQQVENLKRLLSRLAETTKELKVYNTICNSTYLRQKETQEIARRVDVMVVVGGRNSANTTQLATLSRQMDVPTHHIETVDELRDEWFRGARSVGVTAGASTAEWIIESVIRRIENTGGQAQ